ncbi:hypothetical protein BDZ45DRAFT_329168 [Acephala macrosclerotiorum]|nr:hypothetical protein BDZ45DRAFT_329168 [Acephala macrosclerotiorum]
MSTQHIYRSRAGSEPSDPSRLSDENQLSLRVVHSAPATTQYIPNPQPLPRRTARHEHWPARPDTLDLTGSKSDKKAHRLVLPEINIPLAHITQTQNSALEFSNTVSTIARRMMMHAPAESTHTASRSKWTPAASWKTLAKAFNKSRRPTLEAIDFDNYSSQDYDHPEVRKFGLKTVNIHIPECVIEYEQCGWSEEGKLRLMDPAAGKMLENSTLWISHNHPVLKRFDCLGAPPTEKPIIRDDRHIDILNTHLTKGRWIWIICCEAFRHAFGRWEERPPIVRIDVERTRNLFNARMARFLLVEKPLSDFCNWQKVDPKDLSGVMLKLTADTLGLVVSFSTESMPEDSRKNSKQSLDCIKRRLPGQMQKYQQFQKVHQELIRPTETEPASRRFPKPLRPTVRQQAKIDPLFLQMSQRLEEKCSCLSQYGFCERKRDRDDVDIETLRLAGYEPKTLKGKTINEPLDPYAHRASGPELKRKVFRCIGRKNAKGKKIERAPFQRQQKVPPPRIQRFQIPSELPRMVSWNPEHQGRIPKEWCCHDDSECLALCEWHPIGRCGMYPYCSPQTRHSSEEPASYRRLIFPPGWTPGKWQQYKTELEASESNAPQVGDGGADDAVQCVLKELLQSRLSAIDVPSRVTVRENSVQSAHFVESNISLVLGPSSQERGVASIAVPDQSSDIPNAQNNTIEDSPATNLTLNTSVVEDAKATNNTEVTNNEGLEIQSPHGVVQISQNESGNFSEGEPTDLVPGYDRDSPPRYTEDESETIPSTSDEEGDSADD